MKVVRYKTVIQSVFFVALSYCHAEAESIADKDGREFSLSVPNKNTADALQTVKVIFRDAIMENYAQNYMAPLFRIPKDFSPSEVPEYDAKALLSKEAFLKTHENRFKPLKSLNNPIEPDILLKGMEEHITHVDVRDLQEVLIVAVITAQQEAKRLWENVHALSKGELDRCAARIRAYEKLVEYLEKRENQKLFLDKARPVEKEGYPKKVLAFVGGTCFFAGSGLLSLIRNLALRR